MASSSSTLGRDVPQLATLRWLRCSSSTRRRAWDGNEYTAEEFALFYGEEYGKAFWDNAPAGDVAQLADDFANLDASNPGDVAQLADEGDVAQLADDFANLDASNTGGTGTRSLQVVRLHASDLIGVRRQEANRGPPRSLHDLARQALNAISQSSTYAEVDLDDWFEWIPYVAAHRESQRIVGPGITQAVARFREGTNDANRGGAPRLDFCFIRVDGTVCRVHPGRRRSQDAQLVFE
jgi:hypothetical protein